MKHESLFIVNTDGRKVNEVSPASPERILLPEHPFHADRSDVEIGPETPKNYWRFGLESVILLKKGMPPDEAMSDRRARERSGLKRHGGRSRFPGRHEEEP